MSDSAAVPVPTIKRITLSQGAAYMAEGCLQDMSGCNTPGKVLRWGKAWDAIRRQLSRLLTVTDEPAPIDFEKGLPRKEGEAPERTETRARAFNDAYTAWNETAIELGLTPKQFATVQEAIKYAIESKKLQFRATPGMNTNHALAMVIAFEVTSDED